jgi:ubiquinone biosynthesis protein
LLSTSSFEAYLSRLSPQALQAALDELVPQNLTYAERRSAIKTLLDGPGGPALRVAAGRWIAQHIISAKRLVPVAHAKWVPVVQDAMQYVVLHLSSDRLAPKLIEQLEIPPRTGPEKRLLLLIAEVPGLQKLGQVLARNQRLSPALKRALVKLENNIRDVKPSEVFKVIREELKGPLSEFDVRFRPAILSEASVSAVVRFTWVNPETGQRERGVFKVLKPYIPNFFAEDMEILQGLADHFASKLDDYGLRGDVLADTFTKVRRRLEHEVDFPAEQRTLEDAFRMYGPTSKVRVPRPIKQLCTQRITAMSEEYGLKVTAVVRRMSRWERSRLADKLMEALVVRPLFSNDEYALFHADPHAGNLLYDRRTGRLAILDWALTERLSRGHRRSLALLVGFVALRNSPAAVRQIEALQQVANKNGSRTVKINEFVSQYIDELPIAKIPSLSDSMLLLEKLALNGVKFPAPLIMLSKVLLTLDGVVHDLGGSHANVGLSIAQYLLTRSFADRKIVASPLQPRDWISLEFSALMLTGRLWIKGEEAVMRTLWGKTQAATS